MIFTFAWRYFKGKKSTQAIQIISWVSIMAMAAGTAALIIVLSVFNGFEGFIKDLYSNFYPEIKISSSLSKTFIPHDSLLLQLRKMNDIRAISQTLEEKVLFTFHENQVIAILKGVDSAYEKVTGMKEKVKYGEMDFTGSSDIPPVVLGVGVANKLGANEETHLPVTCYAFKKGSTSILDMASAYSSVLFEVRGVYVLQDEIDQQYTLAPLASVADLLQKPGQVSSLELCLDPSADPDQIRTRIKKIKGAENLKVETRYEQNRTLYFILKSERLAVFSILTLMLIIASFNIIGSMSMLVMEKEKDIAILKTMGMPAHKIRHIFVATGILLSLIGAAIGCIIALIICMLQQQFGFVKLGGNGSFLIDAYPVRLHLFDFILVLITVMIIGYLASWIPANKAGKKPIELRLND